MTERPVYEFGPFQLDLARHVLCRDGVETPLTPKLFDLLVILVEARGHTVDKERLMSAVWPDAIVEDGSLPRSISRLRDALGEESGSEQFIKTVARRGYRFAAPVREVVPTQAEAPEAVIDVEMPTVESRPHRAWAPIAGGVLLAVALGLLVIFLWTGRAATRTPRSLAVLPFQSLEDDQAAEALGFGLADSLITRLANQDRLIVRPTNSVSRFTGAGSDSIAAGRALAVDAVLEGTVRSLKGQHRVSARLIDVRTGTPLWGTTFDETSDNLLAVEDRLAVRLSEALSLVLQARSGQSGAQTTSTEAYEAYLRSRFLSFKLTEGAFERARAELTRALELDPTFARAHQALGYLLVNTVDLRMPAREAYPAAKREVSAALALDPSLADAHATMALINWQYEWDFAAADRAFSRALGLDSSNAFVRSQYAFFLASMGRSEEALAEGDRARSLDPVSVDVGIANATTYYWARRYPETADRIARVRSLDPTHWLAATIEGRALEQQGAIEKALEVYERAVRLDGAQPEVLMDIGRAHARLGHRAEAERVLADLDAFGARAFAAPFQIAVVSAALGDKERAFAALDQAIAVRTWYVTWLAVDPSLDPLRSDPRFAERLRRVGFAQSR
jgi:DNA-binding winged helix-turn-helix (wHTH) protein/TolB-like protein